MKPPTECDRDGYLGTWDTAREAIQAHQECKCACCTDWLTELPDELIKDATQTTL